MNNADIRSVESRKGNHNSNVKLPDQLQDKPLRSRCQSLPMVLQCGDFPLLDCRLSILDLLLNNSVGLVRLLERR